MANVTGHYGFHGYCCYSDPIEWEIGSGGVSRCVFEHQKMPDNGDVTELLSGAEDILIV